MSRETLNKTWVLGSGRLLDNVAFISRSITRYDLDLKSLDDNAKLCENVLQICVAYSFSSQTTLTEHRIDCGLVVSSVDAINQLCILG